MATNILTDVLAPSVVTKVVSRIRTPTTPFANWWGVNIGGPNIERLPEPIRQYTYDIFDYTRRVANARMPGAPAGSIAALPVGNNSVTLARFAQKLPMDYNRIAAIRTLGQNAGSIDRLGVTYMERQATELARAQANVREILVGSLLRGGIWYYYQSGDDYIPSFTSSGSLFGVDLKIPSSNKLIGAGFAAGLAMDGTNNCIVASWAINSTDIPKQLMDIDAGFQNLTGQPLRHVWCNHSVWLNVLQNDKVRQLAGSSNQPMAEWTLTGTKAEDGTETGLQSGRIKGIPWIEWHVTNHGLEIYDGVSAYPFTKIIPDDYAMFCIAKDESSANAWLKGVEGSEVVKINDLAPANIESGFFAWIMERADPARFELHGIQNVALELNIPKAIAVARVQ